jgi:uncharacterized protein (UPF0332 family)
MEEKRKVNGNKLITVAKRNLAEMRSMFENRHYYGTINRAYYAMFHAVSALLLLDGKRYKKHSGVITAFGRDYAKAGLVPKEYSELLNKAYDARNKADYDVDMVIDEKMAELYCQKAEELVAFIEKMVAEKLAEDKPTS